MKKAKFIVLVLSVILAFAMFAVACDDDVSTSPETYTVTFVNDGNTVKEAEVEKGNALTADNMPEDPTTGVDKVFDGWFSGETEVKVGYVPTGDVTATATFTQLKKVEFKVGDDVVKTVYVRPGAAITAEDLPEAPAAPAPAPAPVAEEEVEPADDGELVAVIAAAVAAAMEAAGEESGFVVRSIRRVHNAPAWNRAGREEQVYSRM